MSNEQMIYLQPLKKENAQRLVDWNKGKDEDFLMRWAGRCYTYPITLEQVLNHIDEGDTSDYFVFEILLGQQIIGTIELNTINMEERSAYIGRFILAPEYQGKGYGTKALQYLIDWAFDDMELEILRLSVYSDNKAAVHMYIEKFGFDVIGQSPRPRGKTAIKLERRRVVQGIEFVKATLDDIKDITELRIRFLFDGVDLQKEGVDVASFAGDIENYLRGAIADNSFISYLAKDKGKTVAISGANIYSQLPNLRCRTGKTVYISNMYTLPSYRKQGIATKLFGLLMQTCTNLGCERFQLNATEMSHAIYEKFGFESSGRTMVCYGTPKDE